MMRPNPEVMNGVNAVPSERTISPVTNTFPGPYRSATAPATGWIAPHMNCPTASARLIVVMPRPVDVLSGEMKRPSDWRAPIVTIRMAAADNVTTTAGLLQVLIGSPSERFLERPQIDFVRPGAASLPMNLPVRFGNGFNVEQPVLPALADGFGAAATQTLAVDTAVNQDVRHMDSGRPVFARHALRDHAQAGLGSGELRVTGLASKARGCAGEDHRSAAERNQTPRRFTPHEKAAEASDSPESFKQFGRKLAKIHFLIACGVVHDELSGFAPVRWRHCAIEELHHGFLFCRVHWHSLGAAASCEDRRHDLFELAWRATGDQDVQALGRETPA